MTRLNTDDPTENIEKSNKQQNKENDDNQSTTSHDDESSKDAGFCSTAKVPNETATTVVEGTDGFMEDTQAIDLAIQETQVYLETNPDASAHDIFEVVRTNQLSWALKTSLRIHIYARAAIKPDFGESDVKRYAPVVVKLTEKIPLLERHVIAALEAVCVDRPERFPVLLQQLYFVDALEEETILEWAREGRNEFTVVDEESRCALRKEANELVTWLEEEPDSDDED